MWVMKELIDGVWFKSERGHSFQLSVISTGGNSLESVGLALNRNAKKAVGSFAAVVVIAFKKT